MQPMFPDLHLSSRKIVCAWEMMVSARDID